MALDVAGIRGSSPRVRGTDTRRKNMAAIARFIPACAGNRRPGCFVLWSRAVHPRVCGEQLGLGAMTWLVVGSSPRVRGTACEDPPPTPHKRFIPACAGNSCPLIISCRLLTVHPRVCGEQCKEGCIFLRYDGSSPRVRGTVQRSIAGIPTPRFIPACAGNSIETPLGTRPCPVHPRVCGEQAMPVS